jgi:hypothetical protein
MEVAVLYLRAGAVSCVGCPNLTLLLSSSIGMTQQLLAIALLVYVKSNEAHAPTIQCVADNCQIQGYLMCQSEDEGGTCCTKFVIAAKSCPVCFDQCDVTGTPTGAPSSPPTAPIPSGWPTFPTVQPTAKLPFWPTPVPTSKPTTYISQYTGTPSSPPTKYAAPSFSPTYFYERNYAREPPHPKTKSLKALQKKLGLFNVAHISHLKKHDTTDSPTDSPTGAPTDNKLLRAHPPRDNRWPTGAELLERETDVKRLEKKNGN